MLIKPHLAIGILLGRRANHQITAPTRVDQDRLLLTKNPACSFGWPLPEMRYLVRTVPAAMAVAIALVTVFSPVVSDYRKETESATAHLCNKLTPALVTNPLPLTAMAD